MTEKYNCFEPSEIKLLAMHATDLYFANMSEENKKILMNDPIKYTTMYAKIYRDTINELRDNDEFLVAKHRR